MRKKKTTSKKMKLLGLMVVGSTICLLNPSKMDSVEAARVTGSHIGTFNGSTTFTTTSRNGINPGLFIEVMDDDGNLTQYESEEGIITIPDTKEGAYVTQAKLLGKTKYVDEDTGEILDQFEEGRNLKLESSESPGLNGSNLLNIFDVDYFMSLKRTDKPMYNHDVMYEELDGKIRYIKIGRFYVNEIPYYQLKPNTRYTLSTSANNKEYSFGNVFGLNIKDEQTVSFVTGDDGLAQMLLKDSTNEYFDIILEEGETDGGKGHKSNTITFDEDIALRGVGNVRDTLDLMTGELVQRVGEWHITATENSWRANQDFTPANGYSGFNFTMSTVFPESLRPKFFAKRMATLGFATWAGHGSANRGTDFHSNGNGKLVIESSLVAPRDLEGLKQWLKDNKVMMQYELETPTIRTFDLTSNYGFQAITNQNVQVNGEVEPLVVSITVPTDALSFTLDPNQEAGQQFIAPEFMLTNETLAPLQIELKSFEQTTNVLNDVLPDKYDTWEGLNQKESKDIALALVPTPSDGWLTLDEGPRYVVNTSNDLIGTVKGKSTVEFSFHALHGRAFSEVLNPQYRLTFVFGFNQ